MFTPGIEPGTSVSAAEHSTPTPPPQPLVVIQVSVQALFFFAGGEKNVNDIKS